MRYTDPSGHYIPEECPGVPDAVEPGDATGLTQDEYVRWLINYIRWVERDNASHGGVAGVAGSIEQQSVAVELHKLLISEPELADIFYQEVMSAAPQLAAWLTQAGGDVIILSAGWVLGTVREAAKTGRRTLPSSSGIRKARLQALFYKRILLCIVCGEAILKKLVLG